MLLHKLSELLDLGTLLGRLTTADLAYLGARGVVEGDATNRRLASILLSNELSFHGVLKEDVDGATTGLRDIPFIRILDQRIPRGIRNEGLLGRQYVVHSFLRSGHVHDVQDSAASEFRALQWARHLGAITPLSLVEDLCEFGVGAHEVLNTVARISGRDRIPQLLVLVDELCRLAELDILSPEGNHLLLLPNVEIGAHLYFVELSDDFLGVLVGNTILDGQLLELVGTIDVRLLEQHGFDVGELFEHLFEDVLV